MRSANKFGAALESVSQSQPPRFRDIKRKQLELDVFSVSFNVTHTSALPELQLEFIKLHSDDTLKTMYLNKLLLEVYCIYVSKKEFPILKICVLKWSSVFGSTYQSEQLVSKFNIRKSPYRPRLTEKNLSM